MRLMKRGGDKLFRKMGFQTPYFDSGGGQEGRLAIRGLRALEPPASKMGSVTMTRPLSRALRRLKHGFDEFVMEWSNNDPPAFQGIETISYMGPPGVSEIVTMTRPLSRALRQFCWCGLTFKG